MRLSGIPVSLFIDVYCTGIEYRSLVISATNPCGFVRKEGTPNSPWFIINFPIQTNINWGYLWSPTFRHIWS